MQKKLTKESLGEMHPLEIELIIYLREVYRFGPIEILMHDGLPRHILRTVKRKSLGEFEVFHNAEDLQKKYLSDTLD